MPILPHDDSYEDEITYVSGERNQFGWSKQPQREPSPPNKVDRVASGRIEGNLAPSMYSDRQGGIQNDRAEKENDYLVPTYGQDRTRKASKRVDNNQLSTVEDKRKIGSRAKHANVSHVENTYSDPDDDFNALLKVCSYVNLINEYGYLLRTSSIRKRRMYLSFLFIKRKNL